MEARREVSRRVTTTALDTPHTYTPPTYSAFFGGTPAVPTSTPSDINYQYIRSIVSHVSDDNSSYNGMSDYDNMPVSLNYSQQHDYRYVTRMDGAVASTSSAPTIGNRSFYYLNIV